MGAALPFAEWGRWWLKSWIHVGRAASRADSELQNFLNAQPSARVRCPELRSAPLVAGHAGCRGPVPIALASSDVAPSAAVRDSSELLDVDVGQIAWFLVLVAADRLTGGTIDVSEAVDAATDQDRVDGRGRHVEPVGDLDRTEVLLPSQMHDLSHHRGRCPIRLTMRNRRPIHHRGRTLLAIPIGPHLRGAPRYVIALRSTGRRPTIIDNQTRKTQPCARSQSSVRMRSVGHEGLLGGGAVSRQLHSTPGRPSSTYTSDRVVARSRPTCLDITTSRPDRNRRDTVDTVGQDRSMTVGRDFLGVLEYWWLLELFSPQTIPKLTGRSQHPDGRQVVEWRPEEPLPWQVLHAPRPLGRARRVWRHTVYLGVYDLEATYERLHRAFAEDRDAYDERRAGLSACAGVLVDHDGMLLANSAVLSSAAWAIAMLAAGAPPRGTRWASEFAVAGTGLVETFDALDGARREAAGRESPPAQDAESLQRLLSAVHAAVGDTDDSDVATRRVIIDSVAVSAERDDESAMDMDFLNSFFLDDLAAVHDDVAAHGSHGALATFLTPDSASLSEARIDVMVDRQVVDDGVSISRLPKGRWPSEPQHGLALRQQFAVNQAMTDLSDTDGLIGVNGPPGTGKTTMLRDVLAGNVVERARRLASLVHPTDAFTKTTHQWTANDGYPRRVRQLREDLVGFEMVVASSNNAAVENVTAEIPARGAIAEQWRLGADYFADIATATLAASSRDEQRRTHADPTGTPSAWGLIAAKLGNKSNRGTFRSEFWFDKTDPRTKQRLPDTAPRMQSRLIQWRDGQAPRLSWSDAQEAFRRAERRVDELIEARQGAQDRLARLAAASREEAVTSARLEKLVADRSMVDETKRRVAGESRRSESALAQMESDRRRHVETRPQALETLFSFGRAARRWRRALEPLDEAVQEAQLRIRTTQERATRLDNTAARLRDELTTNQRDLSRLGAEIATLRERLVADRSRYGPAYPDEGWTGRTRELRAPWLDSEIDRARSELFLAALRLHEDFLANAARDMVEGLRAAVEVVAGAHPPRLETEKICAAWQLFFLVVPLVSTTFASFGRMFGGLGRRSLGWVFIDEAGQSCPQHAVGAIWRARRVIAVGDPLQLQPVVTMPAKAQRDIAVACGVSGTWIPPRASAQTLVDRVSRYGTTLPQVGAVVWVSAPLTVHRRCDEPMFSLCNHIAYNDIMVSGVTRQPDEFDGPDGPRIPLSRWLDEPARTAGTHLQPHEISRLRRAIETLGEVGATHAEMIAISPFREIADRLRHLERDYPGLRAGTIHTAQGREADVVFLVLGGDPAAPGAKAWAAATVNLVNVAASRAKRRLYVIGDQSAWSKHNYFYQLASALEQHCRT